MKRLFWDKFRGTFQFRGFSTKIVLLKHNTLKMNPHVLDSVLHYLPAVTLRKRGLFKENYFAWQQVQRILGTTSIRQEKDADYEYIIQALTYDEEIPYSPKNASRFWELRAFSWIKIPAQWGSYEITKFVSEVVFGLEDIGEYAFEESILLESLSTLYLNNFKVYRYIIELLHKEAIEDPKEDDFFLHLIDKSFERQLAHGSGNIEDFPGRVRLLISYGFNILRLFNEIKETPSRYNLDLIKILVEEGHVIFFESPAILEIYAKGECWAEVEYLLRRFEYSPRAIDMILRNLLWDEKAHTPRPKIRSFLDILFTVDPNYELMDPYGLAIESLKTSPLNLAILLQRGLAVEGDELVEAFAARPKMDDRIQSAFVQLFNQYRLVPPVGTRVEILFMESLRQ